MALESRHGLSLPAELLLETFGYLPLPDRVAARSVCRAWYAAADGCPVTIPVEDLKIAQLACYLSQLRAAPLLYDGPIYIHGSEKDDVELAKVVSEHIDRTVDLTIQSISGNLNETKVLRAVFERPAPLLERLHLKFWMDTSSEDIAFFGHVAPRLTYCAVYLSSNLIPAISPFKTIRILVLRGLILYDEVELVFQEFPVLEELSLDFDVIYYDDSDDEAEEDAPPPLQPPSSLKRLTIVAGSGEAAKVEPPTAWIQHEHIDLVSFRHNLQHDRNGHPWPRTVRRMLELLALPAVESLVVSWAPTEGALRLVAPDGRARVHAGIPRDMLADLLKTMPLDMTDLVVAGMHALYEPDERPAPDRFAALRTFTLILRQLAPETDPLSASLRIPPSCCPALESVTLAITQAEYDRTGSVRLSAEDVRTFLNETLCEDLRGKLKTLCLRGISVEDESPLRPLADNIIVRSYDPLTGFVYPENDLRRYGEDNLIDG